MAILEFCVNWNGTETLASAAEAFPVLYEVFSKVILFSMFRPKFAVLIKKMDSFWKTDKYGSKFQKEVQRPIKFLNKMFYIYKLALITTSVIYFFKPAFLRQRIYPISWYNICDSKNNLCYFGVYFWQLFNTYFAYTVVIGCDTFAFYLIIRAFCELKFIVFGLENLTVKVDTDGDDPEVLQELKAIIHHHNFVLSFIKDLNNIYSLFLLNLFCGSSISITIGLYLITNDGFPPTFMMLCRWIPFLMVFHVQLLSYCLGGEIIKHQAEGVFYAAYNSGWYLKSQPKLKKSILIIMLKTNVSEIITVGGLLALNLQTFTQIAKTSFSLLTAMQTLHDY